MKGVAGGGGRFNRRFNRRKRVERGVSGRWWGKCVLEGRGLVGVEMGYGGGERGEGGAFVGRWGLRDLVLTWFSGGLKREKSGTSLPESCLGPSLLRWQM